MSQHGFTVDNGVGAAVRAAVNSAIQALASNSSGVTEPTVKYPFMWWSDTANDLLKQRNAANSAWVTKGSLSRDFFGLLSQSDAQTQSVSRFSVGGAADALTGTIAPAITAYVSGLRVTTTPGSANATSAPTLNLNSLGVKTIKKRDVGGSKVALVAGDFNQSGPFDFEYDGADFVLLNPVSASASSKQIQPITASVAANALTITLNPTSLDFRSETMGSGAVNVRSVGAAVSLTVPDTATLGTISAIQNRLVVLAIDNSGTVELAVVNIAGGNDLSETGVISTTAISAAADSNNVIYSTTARTGVPYRVVGYVESTQATAGTWATAPSTIQGIGGQALAAMSSIGYGQSWQNVTGSRTVGTTYYNTTGKPIAISLAITLGGSGQGADLNINGLFMGRAYNNNINSAAGQLFGVVPPGAPYSVTIFGSTPTVATWAEAR